MNVKKADRSVIKDEHVIFKMSRKDKAEIRQAADDLGLSISSFLRVAVKSYISTLKGEAK